MAPGQLQPPPGSSLGINTMVLESPLLQHVEGSSNYPVAASTPFPEIRTVDTMTLPDIGHQQLFGLEPDHGWNDHSSIRTHAFEKVPSPIFQPLLSGDPSSPKRVQLPASGSPVTQATRVVQTSQPPNESRQLQLLQYEATDRRSCEHAGCSGITFEDSSDWK